MKKNLLFLTSQLPELSSGSQVRSYYILEHLKKSFNVTLCCVSDHGVDLKTYKKDIFENTVMYPVIKFSFLQRLKALLSGSIPYVERYRNSIPDTELKKLLDKTDICFFSELNGYFIAERFIERIQVKKIMDAHNVEYIKFAGEVSSKSIIHRTTGFFLTPVVKNIEKTILQKMDGIFACSEQDKKTLHKLAPNTTINVVPNGVDCNKFVPSQQPCVKNSLLFMGSLGYPPNDDGIKYFLEKIYPKIKNTTPGVSLTIIGKGAKEWLKTFVKNDTTVHLEGFVPDVREYIAAASVCICPIRFGSGTRLKILEYMAMEKAVVSTTIGAEGIDFKENEDIFLADTPEAFAKKVSELLANPVLVETMGKKARTLIQEKYDWKNIVSLAVKHMEEL